MRRWRQQLLETGPVQVLWQGPAQSGLGRTAQVLTHGGTAHAAGCRNLAIAIGCAQTSVTPLAGDEVMIHVNAAPACGPDGASNVGFRTAAASTLRSGFERFQVFAGDQDSNVMVINRPLLQGGTIVTGRHSINLRVVMANPGDPMYADGLDARQVLGDDWKSYLYKDISTCN